MQENVTIMEGPLLPYCISYSAAVHVCTQCKVPCQDKDTVYNSSLILNMASCYSYIRFISVTSLSPSLSSLCLFAATSNGSCTEAGFTGCCNSSSSCLVGDCYCDFDCHSAGDCCEDINDTYPATSILPSPSGQFILQVFHTVIHV